jgi:hypothetical protein
VGEFTIFHWLIILAIVLIFFSGRRIPEIMQGFGEGIMRGKRQLTRRPRPLRFSRGETRSQALIRHLHRLLAKILLLARIRRNRKGPRSNGFPKFRTTKIHFGDHAFTTS